MTEMTDTELELRELAYRLYKGQNDGFLNDVEYQHKPRNICVTPYEGAYGNAGYVITINGSPPRGTFITAAQRNVFYITIDMRSRRLQEGQADVVFTFLEAAGYKVRQSRFE